MDFFSIFRDPLETETGMNAASIDDLMILKAAELGDVNYFKRLKPETSRQRCETCRSDGGITAIHYAVSKGRIEVCKYLIEKVGVDINIENGKGNRPLIIAVIFRQMEVAEYLINHGADINALGHQRATALHFAVVRNHTEFVPLLLRNGVNIEGTTVGGTPLQIAAHCGNVEPIKLLLKHGADPNSIPLFTHSALVNAINKGSLDCMEVLLKRGADPNADVYGQSPLAYAAEVGKSELIRSLLNVGANPNSRSTPPYPISHSSPTDPNSHSMPAGLKPIEHAAKVAKHRAVEVLFPVTERISYIPDWSVDGINEYFSKLIW